MSLEDKLSFLAKLADETATTNKLSANTAERAKELSVACYSQPDDLTASVVGPQLDKQNPRPTVSGIYLLDAVSRQAASIIKPAGPSPPPGSPAALARTWIERLEAILPKVIKTTLQHIPPSQHEKIKKVLEIWAKADIFSGPASAAMDQAVKEVELAQANGEGRSTTPTSAPPPSALAGANASSSSSTTNTNTATATAVPPASAPAPGASANPTSAPAPTALPAGVAALLAKASGKTPPATPPVQAGATSGSAPAPAPASSLTSQNTASVLANLSALIKPPTGAGGASSTTPGSGPPPGPSAAAGLDTNKLARLVPLVQGAAGGNRTPPVSNAYGGAYGSSTTTPPTAAGGLTPGGVHPAVGAVPGAGPAAGAGAAAAMTLAGFDRSKFDPSDPACLSQLAYRWQMQYGRPANMVDMIWLTGQLVSASDPNFGMLFQPAAVHFAPPDPNAAMRALILPMVPEPAAAAVGSAAPPPPVREREWGGGGGGSAPGARGRPAWASGVAPSTPPIGVGGYPTPPQAAAPVSLPGGYTPPVGAGAGAGGGYPSYPAAPAYGGGGGYAEAPRQWGM